MTTSTLGRNVTPSSDADVDRTQHWNDRLALELHRHGVRHLSVGALALDARGPSMPAGALLQGLAGSSEARLRSALIPLLLRRPELANAARLTDAHLSGPFQVTLRLFYTAAAILQQQHAARLRQLFGPQPELPDLFSAALGLPVTLPLIERLPTLAARHSQLGEPSVNWCGTYEHAAESYLKMAEAEAAWSLA